MTLFIDTYALIAWLNPKDTAHAKVRAYLNDYTGKLVTTEWVLMEVADALSAPQARRSAIEFLKVVRADSNYQIIGYGLNAYQAGFTLFSTRLDKGWSLTDCISFAVMSEAKLTDALTADHHFRQAGFNAVFSEQ